MAFVTAFTLPQHSHTFSLISHCHLCACRCFTNGDRTCRASLAYCEQKLLKHDPWCAAAIDRDAEDWLTPLAARHGHGLITVHAEQTAHGQRVLVARLDLPSMIACTIPGIAAAQPATGSSLTPAPLAPGGLSQPEPLQQQQQQGQDQLPGLDAHLWEYTVQGTVDRATLDAYVNAARQYNLGPEEFTLRQEVCWLVDRLQKHDYHMSPHAICLDPRALNIISGGPSKFYRHARFFRMVGEPEEPQLWMLPPARVAHMMREHVRDPALLLNNAPGYYSRTAGMFERRAGSRAGHRTSDCCAVHFCT